MAHEIVKQPNGLYGVFSTVVDTFIIYDADEQELENWVIEEAIDNAKKSLARGIELCNQDTARYSVKPRPGDGLNRWREALDTIEVVHGKRERKSIEKLMGKTDRPVDADRDT